MSILLALAFLASLGFCVEELPDLLRRQRLAREQEARDLALVQARLALAIDAQWREFGCARGMTAEELARTRRASAAKLPPPVGPSRGVPMKRRALLASGMTIAEASAGLHEFGRAVETRRMREARAAAARTRRS